MIKITDQYLDLEKRLHKEKEEKREKGTKYFRSQLHTHTLAHYTHLDNERKKRREKE